MIGAHEIAHGDVLAVLRELPSDSFDALLCDPPYGYRFMGKRWDYDVPSVEVWREALRVLKPGAPLLSFGGARTFHRIATAIEDAGFELRDVLMWLYGKGFPKSYDIGKALDGKDGRLGWTSPNAGKYGGAGGGVYARSDGVCTAPGKKIEVALESDLARQWDGYGTALKPAYEPVILARKPLSGTMVSNVLAHGVGGLAIDACRIGADGGGTHCANRDESGRCLGHKNGGRSTSGETFHGPDTDGGRWPANLMLDEVAAAALDEHAGERPSVPYRANKATGAVLPMKERAAGGYMETGGPSRFFYCAKVSTKERELGCEELPMISAGEMTDREDGQAGLDNPRAGAGRTGGARNHHPTLKPIALTKWLATLIKPPTAGAMLLVPYSGAGSEIIGALQAGWPAVLGIEGSEEYIAIAHARIAAWSRK